MNVSPNPPDTAPRPFWIRVIHTPLGDLMRLRVTGRFDVKALLVASGLPEPIQKTVLEVTWRTRLWRSETIHVARELVDRFSDGLAAGETPDRLIEQFGKPKKTARTIRRARLRARPLTWRASMRALQIVVGSVAVAFMLYVLLWARFFWGRANVSWNYLAEFNAETMAIPEEQRAWPLYRAALLELKPAPEGLTVVDDRVHADQSEDPEGDETAEKPERRKPLSSHEFLFTKPGDEHWDAMVAYLVDIEASLDLTRQAAARPRLGFYYGDPADAVERPMDIFGSEEGPLVRPLTEDNPRVLDVHLTHLHLMRKLGQLLRADAFRAAEAHDGAILAADLTAMLGISDHCCDTVPFWVCDLLRISLLRVACDTLGEITTDWPESLSEEQLAELGRQFAAVADGGPIRVRLEGERVMQRDMWQQLYTDNGRGDGHLIGASVDLYAHMHCRLGLEPWAERVDSPAGWLLPALAAGRREIARFADRMIDEAELEFGRPLWKQEEGAMNARLNAFTESQISTVRYSPALLLFPSFQMLHTAGELATQHRDAAMVVIALERYRRRNGHWPERLDELTPDLLPALPPDRFDGRPVKYRITEGRPVVYSIGVDRYDDGGVPPKGPHGYPDVWRPPSQAAEIRAEGSDSGDWVLWPASQRSPW